MEAIVEAVLARFRKEVPGYERISYDVEVQLRATIARKLDLAMQTMVHGRPIEDRNTEPLWESAIKELSNVWLDDVGDLSRLQLALLARRNGAQ